VNSYCQGNITYEKVLEDLNVLDADNYFRIIDLASKTK
jgi:DNA polymerase-3 subunit gamma/tau